jgi:hypothetical protein
MAQKVNDWVTNWMTEELLSGRRKGVFSLSQLPDRFWGPQTLLFNAYWRPDGMKLTILLRSEPQINSAWRYTPLPPYAFMVWCLSTRTISPFTFTCLCLRWISLKRLQSCSERREVEITVFCDVELCDLAEKFLSTKPHGGSSEKILLWELSISHYSKIILQPN